MASKSKYQAYDSEVIHRSQIKNAPYNPRIMDKEAKKRLRADIAKHGLVSSLTWNKRTGNLVGGHQRLEQIDALEKSKDYELTVDVIDVDEKEEVELNILLNNSSVMGDWDLDKLGMAIEDFGLDPVGELGFTESDVDFLFEGDERFSKLFETQEGEDMRGQIEDIKAAKKTARERFKEEDGIQWYTVIVFENEAERKAFHKEISIPAQEEYVTADQVRRLEKQSDQ